MHVTGQPETSATCRRFISNPETPSVHSLCLPVFAVRLPGRESRAREPFFHSMQQVVDEIVGTLLPLLKEKPFALFGHRYDNNNMHNAWLSQLKAYSSVFYFPLSQFLPMSNKANLYTFNHYSHVVTL